MDAIAEQKGLAWQIGVWDRMCQVYTTEIDPRFASVVANLIARADLKPGDQVLDLGTGTAAVAIEAAPMVRPDGSVTAVDISPEMLLLARRRVSDAGLHNVAFREGRAEAIPAEDGAFDVVLASLSLMYVIDRATAASEIRRVLRPGGRLVAAVWAAAEQCDIVLFQQTAGRFAPEPPVPGVGPGALADTTEFLEELSNAGIRAHVETEELGFDFDSFDLAWEVWAAVTAAQLAPERRAGARAAVQAVMWPDGKGPRHFRNVTQFLIGRAE
jgi:SAM-dependent methyltransferase